MRNVARKALSVSIYCLFLAVGVAIAVAAGSAIACGLAGLAWAAGRASFRFFAGG